MDECERNIRTRALIGEDGVRTLFGKKIAVFGLGGVGSACAEALARSGVGTLMLVDYDVVEVSNLNRQSVATVETLGMRKTEAMHRRILSVSPLTRTDCLDIRYSPYTAENFDLSGCDFVIDCVDSVSAKAELAKHCQEMRIPEISCMGVGNRLDPLRLRIGDIKDAVNDPLASAVRKALRRENIVSLCVLYSDEPPLHIKSRSVGSTAFVPPAAGLALAGYAVRNLLSLR